MFTSCNTLLFKKFDFWKGVTLLKKQAHELSKLKHDLYEEKRKKKENKDFIYRKLTPEQYEFVIKFCKVEPHLFEIRKTFRPGFDVHSAPGIVKKVYFTKRSPVYLALTPKQQSQCKSYGLKVIPYKYKIYLNTLQ